MKNDIKKTIRISTLGQQMGIFVGIGFYLGHLGDIHFDTKPTLSLCGAAIGITMATAVLIRATMQTKKRISNNLP